MSAVITWVADARNQRTRALGIALFVTYWVWVWARADSLGQLFNFTFIGLAEGAIFAIAASGVVLTYATTGVFNFGHGAVGMISAYVYYALTSQHDVPPFIAIVLVLAVFAPLVGLALEAIMRFFRDAPVQTTVVVTVAVTILCIGIAQKAWPPETAATLPRLLGGDRQLRIWEATLTYDQVAAIVVAVGVAVLLRALLFASRTGVAMRAVVDNQTLAALNGAPPTTIARYSWILSTTLAAVAGILLASGTNLEPITLTFFVAAAYGAAVVGKLKSLPLTFAGAIALGLVKNHALFALPQSDGWASFRLAIPGIFLFFALLLVPAAKLTVGRIVGRRAPAVPRLQASLVRAGVFLAAVLLIANVSPADRLPDITRAMIYALLLLSVVVLTGFSGQTSLCQYVFMAIGAWAMGKSFGGNSILGMGLAGLAAVPLGVLVAVPALRLQGLYLALVTFGFAAVSRDLVLQNRNVFGGGNVSVGRLELFGLDFSSNKSFLLLCTLVFVLAGVGVLALKRGAFGRRLAAMRDSQAACATLGLDVRRTKLAVFALSAFIAGVAGALFGGLGASASTIQFEPIQNIVLLLFAVVGGVTTVTGALIGGVLFALLPLVQSEQPNQAGLVFAGIAVAAVALGRQPNGLAGMVFELVHGMRSRSRGGATDAAAREDSGWLVRMHKTRTARFALGGVVLLLAMAVNGSVQAQTSPASEFGGFQVAAAGEGVSIAYDSPGLIPGTPSPLMQVSLPEAQSTFDGGPNGYALASVAYPGPILADLPTLLAVAGYDTPLPAYPVRTQSYFPSGPLEADQTVGPAQMNSRTSETGSQAFAGFTSAQLPGILTIGAMTSTTDTHVEDGQVVSRVRVELSGVDLVAGLIHIDSVVTDVVATSNGMDSATDGSTVVSGVSVLGLPATVDADGIHFTQAPTAPTTTAASPIGGALDPLGLGGVAEPLQPVADALSTLLTSTVGTTNDALNDLLSAGGISLRLIDPVEVRDGPNASRTAFGLQLILRYDGETTPVMSQVLDLIPVESLPSQGVGPIPFSSPQAMVLALKATHVNTVGLAPGTVSAQATPPYVPTPRPATSGTPSGSSGSSGSPSLSPSGFSTPAPSLGGSSGTGSGVGDALPIAFAGAAPLSAIVVALALVLTSAFAWGGSGRLADNVLSVGGSSCPEGLDQRAKPGGVRGGGS